MIYKFSWILILQFLSFLACQTQSKAGANSGVLEEPANVKVTPESDTVEMVLKNDLPYDLDLFDEVFPLSSKLIEISGLSYLNNQKQVAAINDEQGILFLLDTKSFNIAEQIKFGKSGDYEGVELVNNIAYVVKSNGTIYSYDLSGKGNSDHYKTALNSTNDIEGLGYHAQNNALLLATKNNPFIEKRRDKKTKCIYRFDLNKKVLDEDPYITIDKDKLIKDLENSMASVEINKAKLKKLKRRINSFSPSGISVHPITKDFYILSSSGKTMLVIDKTRKNDKLFFLDSKQHIQPEGICFSPDGTMYISNEGKSLIAKIYKYKYLN